MIVLFATDGTPAGLHAIREATNLLPLKGATLFTVAVAPTLKIPIGSGPMGPAGGSLADEMEATELMEEAADTQAAAAARELGDMGFPATPLERGGEPTEAILATSREVGADLIVLGAHSFERAPHGDLGRVPDEVMHLADKPVLVIR
ncbi:MAG: universal stress protein [Cyanobacteria bacterium RYN_339]|nr:universal stress protein [Cyanobacteria bacterium RYN_339]